MGFVRKKGVEKIVVGVFKTLILANWRNNCVVGAALPADNNALKLRSICPTVSEIRRNV
jgi:hypothetical protein